MDAFLASFTTKDLTFGVLLGLTILMILHGRLVPIKHHEEIVTALERHIALVEDERDKEKKAKDDALAANRELMLQNSLLLEKDDTANSTLVALREFIRRHENGDAG